jgi:RNase P subunit RPR2
MSERLYYSDAEWEHGLSCPICERVLVEGDEYRTRLESFQDDIPVLLVVCAACEDSGRALEVASTGVSDDREERPAP